MKKRLMICLLAAVFCLTAAVPALAANTFLFTEKIITLFEGESAQTALKREGNFDGEGEIVYTSSRETIATVSADGMITAIAKGRADVYASLMRNGKRVARATIAVNVLRAVTKVTLNTTKLSVYDPDDPAVAGLLKEPTVHQVLVIPAGGSASLVTTCTPETASSRKVVYSTTDAGVARLAGTTLRAVQRGECELTVASEQNPEITETFRVLVIQPVKKIQFEDGKKEVAAGSTLQLTAVCAPDNASITGVTWTSQNPTIATVDENGTVTGLKKGNAKITATATDGSRTAGSVIVRVTQPVTMITVKTPEIQVTVGKSVQAKATAQPDTASDRKLVWSSSDETIATVNSYGVITGKKAGTCIVTCTSNSNPDVTGTVTVTASQPVTKIENANEPEELSLLTGQTVQTRWNVQPADATDKTLTFKSRHPRVVTVDANGVVTAVGRGTATVEATAKDGSRKQGSVRITVIQPVTGVEVQQQRYYVQWGRSSQIRAIVQPRNANNQQVYWSSEDEGIASVRSTATSTGSIYGVAYGTTTVTAWTEDGGFSASAEVRVGNFIEAVLVEELYVDSQNNIQISLRNMTQDLTLGSISYRIECFDTEGNPFVCNTDGVSMYFDGEYVYGLPPMSRTYYGYFTSRNCAIDRMLGGITLTITGWQDAEGNAWQIPDNEQVRNTWNMNNYNYNPGEGVG